MLLSFLCWWLAISSVVLASILAVATPSVAAPLAIPLVSTFAMSLASALGIALVATLAVSGSSDVLRYVSAMVICLCLESTK